MRGRSSKTAHAMELRVPGKTKMSLQDGSAPENRIVFSIMFSIRADKDVRMVVVLYGSGRRITFRVRPSGRLRVGVVRLCFVERDDRGDDVWQT